MLTFVSPEVEFFLLLFYGKIEKWEKLCIKKRRERPSQVKE